ncbi:hypothetical protein RHGRI_014102 [Rhododendron griersonianum]|uniref:Uncharacterized protein n=1 Tax=Rhododendron griersonianum TaxID=479676 RepID=A0AAV6K854_9ERIC|nr:hypothetical protein RHGRI_014102 [Rhododendron griersonianum]
MNLSCPVNEPKLLPELPFSLSLSPKHGLLEEVVGTIEAGGDGLIVEGGRRNQNEGQEVVDGVEEGVGINGVELDLASMEFSLRLHLREWVPIIHMISAVENEARSIPVNCFRFPQFFTHKKQNKKRMQKDFMNFLFETENQQMFALRKVSIFGFDLWDWVLICRSG